MRSSISESDVEQEAVSWLRELGYDTVRGQAIAPGETAAERDSFSDVLLSGRLRDAIHRLNPAAPSEALEEAYRKVRHPESPSLVANNRRFHWMLRDGVEVEYRRDDGSTAGDRVHLIDFEVPDNNDWLAVNQFAVVEGQHNRRPDIVVFINGLPLAVIELKNPADEDANIWVAFNQLQTYKLQMPSLFVYNELMVISDGLEARVGSLTEGPEWFKIWREMEGSQPTGRLALETLTRGVFRHDRILEILRHFIVFEEDTESDRTNKIIAGYHQIHAVQNAVEATIAAIRPRGIDGAESSGIRRAAARALSMLFYAGRMILHPAMDNPTIVVLTDRNDLDDQLFGQFSRCHELLRQRPVQAESREQLQQLLQVASGGVVFTTIQKFFPDQKGDRYPELSKRRNIVVIADEAHRSQYDMIDGFARHMRDALPNASFIGFHRNPHRQGGPRTPARCSATTSSIYDIQQAVEDGATVPIYYESRLAKLELDSNEVPRLDEEFDEITEDEEESSKERLKIQMGGLGGPGRHREADQAHRRGLGRALRASTGGDGRQGHDRLHEPSHLRGPVQRNRRAASRLAPRRRRPGRNQDRDDRLRIGPAGLAAAHPQQTAPQGAGRPVQGPKTRSKIVIVRDMWLTGFDAPCLHTMYVDKPMRGHGLMQAIARVNRVFRDKPGGLVVDYLGHGRSAQEGDATYTAERREGKAHHRHGRSRGRHAGEVRSLLCACCTASTGRSGRTGPQFRAAGDVAGCPGARA